MDIRRRKNTKTALSVLKLLLLVSIMIGVPLYVYFFQHDLIERFNTLEGVNRFLVQYKTAGIFALIGLQIAQVVISIIPGQVIQFAGGYAYGFWAGYLFSIAGVAVGTSLAFGIARVLGRDAMHLVFGEERVTKFVNQINSKRAFAILVVIYAIPGMPKDLVTYAAGVSEFRFIVFLLLSLVARTPAMMISIMLGSMVNKESYIGMIVLSLCTMIVCLLLFRKRHALTQYIDTIYQDLIHPKQRKKKEAC